MKKEDKKYTRLEEPEVVLELPGKLREVPPNWLVPRYTTLSRTLLMCLGATQILLGLAAAGLQVAWRVLVHVWQWDTLARHSTYAGCWGGVLIILSGAFSLSAGEERTKRLVYGTLVTSLLATVAGVCAGVVSICPPDLHGHALYVHVLWAEDTTYQYKIVGALPLAVALCCLSAVPLAISTFCVTLRNIWGKKPE